MTTDAVGGVWRYALDLAAGLAREDVATTLVGMGPPPDPAQQREAEAIARLEWLPLPLDWTAVDAQALAPCSAALEALARTTGADLLHLNSPALAADLAAKVPVVVAAHSCLATWWQAVRHGPLPEDWTWRVELNRSGFAAADLVLAPSRSFAEALRSSYGPIPLRVVHNGRAGQTSAASKEPLIISVGRWWDEGKNLAALDEAAGTVDWPIEAIGALEGPNGASALRPRFVRATGSLPSEEVAERLGRAALFVSTTLYEPFGLGVLEAAQAGCALVLSDIPTFRELWGEAALFVDPRSPRDIAAALNQVARDPSLAAELAGAARRRAERYTLDAQVSAMLEAYALVLSSPSLAAAG